MAIFFNRIGKTIFLFLGEGGGRRTYSKPGTAMAKDYVPNKLY